MRELLAGILTRLNRLAEFFQDARVAKAMVMLGPAAAFGPRCRYCKKPRIEGMLPAHREYAEKRFQRLYGRPLPTAKGVCQCPPLTRAL